METGWMVERRQRGTIEWLRVTVTDGIAGLGWTSDPLLPLRFAREIDGREIARFVPDDPGTIFVTEHGW